MKNHLEKLFCSKAALAVFTVFSAFSTLCFYSVRYGYVYVDMVLYTHFTFGLFLVTAASWLCLVLLLRAKLTGRSPLPDWLQKLAAAVCELLSVVAFLFSVITLVTDDFMSFSTVLFLAKEALPYWALAVLAAFFLLLFPLLQKAAVKKGICIVTALGVALTVYAALFPITPLAFTSAPVVFDTGRAYAVVFSTNDTAIGYLEYSLDGETVRRYDETNGRKNGDTTIHTVRVPKAALSENSYTVGATRVIDELGYGGRLGKTIESETYTLHDTFGETVDVLTLSDWHTKNERAKAAAAHLGSYQAVILLGDCAPSLMCEQDITKYILDFAHDLSGGTMPVLYVRGNHETRGREANKLADHLGLDSFYYTTSLGGYDFVVLDSAEDKEDTHPEYGGMDDYETHRREMVDWLETVAPSGNPTIALCHDNTICREEDLSARALAKLESLGVSLLVSGHWHTLEFDDTQTIPTFVDGGKDCPQDGSYTASMLHLSPSSITLQSTDQTGADLLTESLPIDVR